MDNSQYFILLIIAFLSGFVSALLLPERIKSKQNPLQPYKIVIVENDTTFYYKE
jgi:hypothetical protein